MEAHSISTGATLPRFIVGMPRAGSTWLVQSLNEHPQIAAFGETAFWGRCYIEPDANQRYGSASLAKLAKVMKGLNFETVSDKEGSILLPSITPEQLPRTVDEVLRQDREPLTPGDAFMRFCGAIAAAERKSFWIEKTPHHINWTDRILHWLPNARFVVMLREPYSFMLSYKHQKGWKGKYGQLFARLYHPAGCALVYRGYTRAALHLAATRPRQTLFVRLEDIQQDPRRVLEGILDFFLIEPHPRMAGRIEPTHSSFEGGPKPELSAADIFWMRLIGSRDARRIGYDMPRVQWSVSSSLCVVKSILSLGPWAVRAYLLMARRIRSSPARYLWRWVAVAARGAGSRRADCSGSEVDRTKPCEEQAQ